MIYGDGTCAVGDHPAKEGQLMCAQHWRQVSPNRKNDVYLMLARYNRNGCTLGELRAAQDAAVTAVGGTPRSEV